MPDGADLDAHERDCAKAAFLADKLCKNYLVRCWTARENLIGKISVANGCLVRERPPRRILSTPSPKLFAFDDRSRWELLAWRPRDTGQVRQVRAGKRKAFFVVLEGRATGIFYRWCDVRAAVAGMPEARYKGYGSLRLAEEAWEAGRL